MGATWFFEVIRKLLPLDLAQKTLRSALESMGISNPESLPGYATGRSQLFLFPTYSLYSGADPGKDRGDSR